MSDLILFAFLGLAAGAAYALLAQGIVLIFKGSGVLNFGHGAVALIGAVAVSDLEQAGWSSGPAIVGGLVISLVAGALIYLLIMRPLRLAPALARHVATLGLLIGVPVFILITHSGIGSRAVPSVLPSDSVTLLGVTFGVDRLYLFGIAVVVTVLLTCLYRFTRLGLATRAVAESDFAASILGFSPNTIGCLNWMLGTLLAGGAGILLAPITGLDPTVLPLLVVEALAAALVGNFTSFPVAGAAALLIGVLESEMQRFWSQPGSQVIVPFGVIILAMVLRNRALPSRDYVLNTRPPKSLAGRFRVSWAVGAIVAVLVASELLDGQYVFALQSTLIMAVIIISQVIVTGFAGQVSLAQMTFAGIGALLTARFSTSLGVPFPFPILIAALITAPIGVVLGLPAVRVRGVNLAVVTLGLSVAVTSFVFGNSDWTNGPGASPVPSPSIFGWPLDAAAYPDRYAFVALVALLLVIALAVWVRRGPAGRRMLAVRENERAAAAAGINVPATKLKAFALAASIAAVGGGLLAYQSAPLMPYNAFDPSQSAMLLALAYIGGVASISGAPLAALTFASTGLLAVVFSNLLGSFDQYLTLASGLFLIMTIIFNPDGMSPIMSGQLRSLGAWVGRSVRGRTDTPSAVDGSAPVEGRNMDAVGDRQAATTRVPTK